MMKVRQHTQEVTRLRGLTLALLMLLAGCGSGVRSVVTEASTDGESAAGLKCVTFIGDSITEAWPMDNFRRYDGGCYINHGRGGTTMGQILDGIDNHALPYDASVDPSVSAIAVVGGDVINSLYAGYTVAQIEDWYEATILKLQNMAIKPVLCTTLPTSNAPFNEKTAELNTWLRARAAAGNIPLADIYNTALVARDGSSNPAYFSGDRVHLLVSAYTLLTPVVAAALKTARA